MNTKKLQLLVSLAILWFACAARAQFMSGSISAAEYTDGSFVTATASSLTFYSTNIISSATGSFVGVVPQNSILLGNGGEIDGLSTTPLSDSISRFFEFSAADAFPGLTSPGTTPAYRFDFDLETITENSYNSDTGVAVFSGTGTVVDTTGAYEDTSANFTIDFSDSNDYTLTLDVPEPGTISLVATGLLGLLTLRRRKV